MAIKVTLEVWILIIEILPQSLTIYGKPRFTTVSRIALPRIAAICLDYAYVCGGWLGNKLPISWCEAPRVLVTIFGFLPLLQAAINPTFVKPKFRIFWL